MPRPSSTAEQQAAAITAGAADFGTAGADNTYGAGLVEALTAWNALP
jgi:hypothetical protein